LADVRTSVREKVIAQRGLELAKKDGAEKLAAWKAAPATAVLPAAVVASRDQPQNVPQPVLEAALRADTTTLPAWIGVDLGAQGYAIAKVNSVVVRPAPVDATAKQERAQYSQMWSKAESLAYYNVLKERYKTQIIVPKPARNPLDPL
jgi:peptidyl-prolyl cis-trans isomerase D